MHPKDVIRQTNPLVIRDDLDKLSKNVYTDLAAQDDSHSADIDNLTTAVNDLGNSLMEAGAQRRADHREFSAWIDEVDHALTDKLTDLNDRMRRVEKRLDNAATFGNGSIQDAFKLLNEQQLQINALRRQLEETHTRPADDDASEWAIPMGSQVGPKANLEASETGMAQFVDLHAPAPKDFTDWQERTRADAEFLRFLVEQKYSFPKMVQDGLRNIADRLDKAANESDGSWV